MSLTTVSLTTVTSTIPMDNSVLDLTYIVHCVLPLLLDEHSTLTVKTL